MASTDHPIPRRSMLFTPGLRPDRIRKAITAGADVVCIDIEDAVAVDHKDEARDLALQEISAAQGSACEMVLRINSLASVRG